jgi:uncharacterized membrane protein
MKKKTPSDYQNEQWQNDPGNWLFGILYFNPKDKRIFPPKRIPSMGWKVNFDNPISVMAMIGILLAIAVIINLVKLI